MQRQICATATILATFFLNPVLGLSQPSPTGRVVPGHWQPSATVNVGQSSPVGITVRNETGISLEYDVPLGSRQIEVSSIEPNEEVYLGSFSIVPNATNAKDRNLNISFYPTAVNRDFRMHFSVIEQSNNNLEILIRNINNFNYDQCKLPSAVEGEDLENLDNCNIEKKDHLSIYIDEEGRLYFF